MTDGASLDPSELDQASFELVRRGFDPLPVQRTLQRAAAVIRELRRERDVLAARIVEVEAVLSEPLEAHRVAEALGAEATQVLEAAHAAAAERAERAEREAEAIRAEALTAADTTRAEAIAAENERPRPGGTYRRQTKRLPFYLLGLAYLMELRRCYVLICIT